MSSRRPSTLDSPPHIEHKCVGIAGFKVDSVEEGIVTAIVAVTGKRDNVKDVIKPGAFEKSLIVRTPKGVWHHQWQESISKTLAIKELMPGDPELPETLPNGEPWPKDAGGLQVKTQFNLETQRGREAYSDVVFFGDEQEWSIGYNVPVGGATIDSKTGIRSINTMDLYEYSPVLFGAMPAARTASVKDAQLAYKALMAENDDDTFDDIELADDQIVEEKTAEDLDDFEDGEEPRDGEEPDEDVEEQDYQFDALEDDMDGLTDDVEEKAARAFTVSGAQAAKLQRAARSLLELLSEANIDEGEDTNTSGDNAVSLVTEMFEGDKAVRRAAEDFDDAFTEGNGEEMEKQADIIMTAVEEAVNNGDDPDNFEPLLDYLTMAFSELPGDEEEGAPEAEEEPEPATEDTVEKKSAEDDDETEDEDEPTVTMSLSEIMARL